MTIKGLIFDLDGTLIDSRGDIAAACQAMLKELGHPVLSLQEISSFVGDGARALVERALPATQGEGGIDEAVELFLRHYEKEPVARTTLLRGVQRVLDEANGFALAVCTNKPRRTAVLVLEGMSLSPFFPVVVAGGDTAQRKPNPEPVLRAIELLGLAPEEVLMIGDGPQDVLAARAAGVRSVGVKGGILELERLVGSNPDHLLESLEELLPLLATLNP